MKNKHSFFTKVLGCAILSMSIFMNGISGIASESAEKFYSQGYITLEGEQKYEKSGSTVTLVVTKNGEDWTLEEEWAASDGSEVVYYKEYTLGEGNTYNFNFVLPESDIYTALISSKTGGNDKKEIVYVNSDKNKIVINNILATDDIPVSMISENLADLGVFAFEAEDVSVEAVAMLSKALENKADVAWEEMASLTEKAILIAKINDGTAKSFYEYSGLNMIEEKIFNYCGESIANDTIDALKNAQIATIENFDKALIEETVLQLANGNDNGDALRGVLNEYSEKLGVNKVVTLKTAKAAIVNGNFGSCSDVVKFVNEYVTPSGGSFGGSGGGSGGSSGGSGGSLNGKGSKDDKNDYNYATSIEDKEENVIPAEISIFEDIEDVEWARTAIIELYKKNVINGKTEKLFCPNDYVTREEFAKILMLAFDVNLVDEECPFTDVTESDWSYDYIRTAYLAGVVNGIGDNIFGKDLNITRQDLCTMVYRLIKIGNSDIDAAAGMSFADANEISDYAKEAVGIMQSCGIINGDDNGKFNPNKTATRAEAVKIVYNAMLMYENSK